MPEIRHFIVTETRMVKVNANNVADAARIADKAFGGQLQTGRGGLTSKEGLDGVWGDTTSRVRQTELNVQERF